MKILLTNDDSITAEGIRILARHLAQNHKVTVIAPKQEMSGISHSFTIFSPLFVDEVRLEGGLSGFAVSGTPSDCVKLGVRKLLQETPDLVISGFNPGENAGISSFYSGTVAGAREGAFFGIPSLSLSLSLFDPGHYAYALQWLDRLLIRLADRSIVFDPRSTYLNINFPHCAVKDIKGTRVTRQGTAPFNDEYEERVNPSGKKYYWLYGDKTLSNDCRYDEKAVRCAYVTVTPLAIDMTDNTFFEKHSSDTTFV